MRVEIVSTGTELLLGEILNTNFQYLAEQLNLLGFDVLYESTVGDNWQRMKEVLQEASKRAEIVITIGGLGPTQGDITKEVSAELFGRELILAEEIARQLRDYFAKRKMVMPESNLKQAYIPEKSLILENDRGTAPGIWLEHEAGVLMNLPGPPHELKHMFENQVIPKLLEKYGPQGTIYSRTLKTVGLGESAVAEKLYDLIKEQTNPTIALYARAGEIVIRLTAKAQTEAKAQILIADLEQKVAARLTNIYGQDGETLPSVLGKLLKENNLTISLAESCTGGLASSMLTDISGSSEYFLGSLISYSNAAKTGIIKVEQKTLANYGAVSQEVAKQMAKGAQQLFASDIGVGITGIAGPGGGSIEKPVGTVWLSVYFRGKFATYKCFFPGEREQVKLRSAKMALFYVLETIKKNLKGS